jgi:hypothetical protein
LQSVRINACARTPRADLLVVLTALAIFLLTLFTVPMDPCTVSNPCDPEPGGVVAGVDHRRHFKIAGGHCPADVSRPTSWRSGAALKPQPPALVGHAWRCATERAPVQARAQTASDFSRSEASFGGA